MISYVILFVTIENLQLSLANHKCLNHANNISLLEKSESVKEIFLEPKIMEMPQRNEIACFVMTTAKNRNARSVIRRSWGKIIKPLFVMNKSDNYSEDFLINEGKLFDDMIIIDDERDLRLSIAFQYFVKYFNNSIYFLQTHDDVYINSINLYNLLNNEFTQVNAIIGNVLKYPHKRSLIKYFGFDYYKQMNYVDHSTYLMPGHMVENIFKISLNVGYFMPENVLITGYIPKLFNYQLYHYEKFISPYSKYFRFSTVKNYIAINKLSPDEMLYIRYNNQKPLRLAQQSTS